MVIKSIVIEQGKTKIPPYADDTTSIAVLSDVDSTNEFFKFVEIFRQVSVLKLNNSRF